MSDESTNRRNRRAVLRAGLVAGTALVAGCSGGGGDGTDTDAEDEGDDSTATDRSTATSEPSDGTDTGMDTTESGPADPAPTPLLDDDFEDGDYTADPAWEELTVPNDDLTVGSVEIVDSSAPGEGSNAARITDRSDGRVPGPTALRLADPLSGVDGAWTMTGLFSPAEIADGVIRRHNMVSFYWPPDANFGNRAVVEFRFTETTDDVDGQQLQFRTQPQENREWSTTDTDAATLDTDTWYRWELVHDGTGGYTGRRWPADGSRDGGSELTVDFEAPGESVQLSVEVFSSDTTGTRDPTEEPGSFPYSVDHDYVRVTPQ
ncbi:hypothetical protein [Halorientalis marina]|uniref:hypothetical protein n=1 Tax=Halorientalis marina TaxID=2931976 RepID=UPI001FF521C6|nr:hypothetical protein [Halorientalis marina]